MASRRSVMTLFSAPDELQSHRVRVVLAEKASEIEVINVVPGRYPEDLLDLNPYRSLPTLVDRDLVLYDARVIIDYLDERFPHPPLMPVDPVLRAQFRLAMYRVERDWYALADQLEHAEDKKDQARLRKELREAILATSDVFKIKPWFLNDEFSVVDATLAPILWRLKHYEIDIPPQAQPLARYAAALLARPSVRASLSEVELDMARA
jgi:RNA polymerase-associated protein